MICIVAVYSLPEQTLRLRERAASERKFGIVGGKETHIRNHPYTVNNTFLADMKKLSVVIMIITVKMKW